MCCTNKLFQGHAVENESLSLHLPVSYTEMDRCLFLLRQRFARELVLDQVNNW